MNWEGKPLSPNALADDEYLASVAKDLARMNGNRHRLRRERRHRERSMSARLISTALSAGFRVTMGKAVRQMVVEPLTRRIAELEAQRGLKYVGHLETRRRLPPRRVCELCRRHLALQAAHRHAAEQMPRGLATIAVKRVQPK